MKAMAGVETRSKSGSIQDIVLDMHSSIRSPAPLHQPELQDTLPLQIWIRHQGSPDDRWGRDLHSAQQLLISAH